MKHNNKWMAAVLPLALVLGTGASWAADKVYVANEGADTVSVLDATTLKTLTSVRVGQMPHNVQVSPDGQFAWVTNNGAPAPTTGAAGHQGMAHDAHPAATAAGAVWIIDTRTDEVAAQVAVGQHPAHVVLTPDGRHAYVTNGGDNTVSVIDASALTLVATIAVGQYPHGLRARPDGKEIYVANLKAGTVSVIDTASQQEVAQIAAGKGPAQTGFTPDGRWAFVSLSQESAVALIDPSTRQVVRKIAVGSVPIQLYATADSRTLLVANQGSRQKPGKTVSLISLDTFQVVKTIGTAAGAHGVVVDRDGRYAYITNTYANSVSVLDVPNRRVTKTIPVGKAPNGISITP
jgi:YVTN family beta-propeller protein